MIIKIGNAAGVIYTELELGASNLSNLKNKLANMGFDSNISMMAVGWLAREDKLHINKEGKIWAIKLK